MRKIIFVIFIILVLVVTFFTPARNHIAKLFSGEKKDELRKSQFKEPDKKCNQPILEAQDILEKMGFYEGDVDGIDGPQTRMAISAFQKKKGLKPTGRLDEKTKSMLTEEKLLHSFSNSIIPMPQENIYLDDKPDRMAEKNNAQDEVLSYRLKSKDRIKQVQLALKEAGLYKDSIDGVDGQRTQEAIKAFQKSKGLSPDGIVGSKTWEELNKYLKN